jgi:hypothetical protein
MVSTVQEYHGLAKALDRLEDRVVAYRKLLLNMSLGYKTEGDIERIAITNGEVETIEAMIRRYSRRVTGDEPLEEEWELMGQYCSKNEAKKEEWADQNYEYFRWALLWIQKSRTYIEYLSGLQSAVGDIVGSSITSTDRSSTRHDVALSFAGEDREHARKIAGTLREANLSVFYDEYEQATLWGRNLYTHLSDVYQNKAKYCLMFISEHYAKKLWTKREREAAQARAFKESREYILPLRLDDTEVPGLEETVGYIDLRTTSNEEVVELLIQKLRPA